MHLHTVHTSSYYTAPATTNTNSTGPCLSVTMTSRVMRGIQTCISTMSTTNSSPAFNATTASPTHFTLHARNTESKGLSKPATYAIAATIIGVIFALTVVAGCLSKRATFGNPKHRHGHTLQDHIHHTTKGAANLRMRDMQNYRGDAGLSAPPRSHGGRARAPQFPGPRNGFGPSSRSRHASSGPYALRDPYSDVPTWGAASRGMYH